MVDVKVLKPHINAYGTTPRKKKGETYSMPEDSAKRLVAQGLVEIATAEGKALSAMSKAELVEAAAAAGVEHSDSDTKAALIEKIEAAAK